MTKDVKQREMETYDKQEGERPYGSLWDGESLDYLLDLEAQPYWSELLDEFASEGKLLDIGCGSGSHLESAYDRNSGRIVSGVEISREQIKDATDPISEYLIQGDGERLPYKDDSFRTVLTHSALHHLPDWSGSVIKEIKRVLQPGGHFLFWEPGKYNPPAAIRRRFLPSDNHTPDEQPFDPNTLKRTLTDHFGDVEMHGYCLLSNIFPVLSKYVDYIDWRPVIRSVVALEDALPYSYYFSWLLVGHAHNV